ncbi:MAG: hypothetical protein PHE17_16785 [Thiothrix sp.]|nr:hypothetical protein [Thiothrix sp.]MDD5394591.1 hypothetical protein [Thiothrix sp.]MDD5394673.1 hypothetical protein [Thiothrix sp.]
MKTNGQKQQASRLVALTKEQHQLERKLVKLKRQGAGTGDKGSKPKGGKT